MPIPNAIRVASAGLLGGFAGNGVLGALFSSPPIKNILYNPTWQSKLFIDVTPNRNIPISVAGLIVLSIIHAWLYQILQPSIPGKTWSQKGCFWGMTICLMFWVFQEWFIYHTLLKEPLWLNGVEICILLLGSLAEGLVIARLLFQPEVIRPTA